ncbi:MAG: DsbA family protein, partial [Hyphomonadaceae bacterium]|nr:DsbA family protein [Hyphomonadaceae bacterium]
KGLEFAHTVFKANFTEVRSISDHAVLIDCARKAGLDADRARAVLSSDEFATVVRTKEQAFAKMGIYQTPTVLFNDFWTIPGAQAPQVYAQAIRSILSGEAKPN